MLKLKITFLLMALICSAVFLNAQSAKSSLKNTNYTTAGSEKYSSADWVSMMRDRTVNIHDVQKAFYKWYKIYHNEDKDKTRAKSGEEDDGAYEFFKRWEWFNLPRADVNGNRPDLYKIGSDYQMYLNNSQVHESSRIGAMHSSPPSTGTWTYAGNTTVPTNSSSGNGGDGRINRVRLMPGNTNTMYACAPSGGLWKTTNSGTSWTTNTDQLGDLSTSDIAINPLKTNIMYLATGDADGIQSIYQTPATIGVLKSYNGGATWVATGLAETMSNAGANSYALSELLIDPNDTSVLIAATTFGIYRSGNSGATWTMEQSGWFHSVEFEPGHPAIVYAGASSLYSGGAAFYRSVNNGITWTQITAGLPTNTQAEGFEIGVSPADSDDVYVLADAASDFSFYGLYLSTNHGVSFSTQSTSPDILGWSSSGAADGGQGWYTLSMAVSQTNIDSIWVGGVNIWASSNGGSTWHLNSNWQGTPYVHADIHSIQFIPGTNSKGYVVGCDGGVFSTANSGSTWTDKSNNLEIAQQYCISASAITAGKWLSGWQDNGTNLSNAPWAQAMGGDGMDCFISWASNNDMYAETGGGGLNNSTNGGTTWHGCTSGISENGPWVTPWVQDPKTSTTFYSGFVNVWKATGNVTPTWTQISTWGSSGISAIAVDSTNPNYIYAAQSNMIELSTNAGTSWTNITGSLPSPITGIAVNSKKPSHVWVTIGGYTSGSKVYESTNSGSSWTNISSQGGGLPNLPVNCIVSESGSPNGIYVGTDQGVYYHDTVINNWIFYNSGLPLVMIGDLTIYKPGKELIAATYGRGTWESPLYTTSKPVAYFEASPTSACVGSAVSFTDTSSNSPSSWKWTFTGGIPATATTQTVSVVYTTPGTYAVKLVVTNSNGSDSLTKNAYITVNSNPAVTSTVLANIVCRGSSTGSAKANPSLGVAPYTYSWAPGGGTNQTASSLSAGTYTVTLTDHNGCIATAAATITQPATGLSVSASVTTNLNCNGSSNAAVSSVPSGGSSPYTYAWTGGGTNSSKNGLSGGTYTITVTDIIGCTASATVTVSEPAALVITPSSVNDNSNGSCNGQASVSISGGIAPYTYSWSPGGGTNDSINGKCPNRYCCVVTDSKGCKDSMCITIVNVTGIANINNSSTISIYPDPNNGSFTIAGVIKGQVIELYNALGQKLSSSVADNSTMSFDISNKADGIYLVRIVNKDGAVITQQKILKAQ